MAKTKDRKTKKRPAGLPSKEQVLAFIEDSSTPVGKREIARAFNIKGDDKRALKALLRELKDEGQLERHAGRQVATPGRLPEVTVIQITGQDEDGETLAEPVRWDKEQGRPPRIFVAPDRRKGMAPGSGERVLARLSLGDDGAYEAKIIRRLGRAGPREVLGIYEPGPRGRGTLSPVDKRAKQDFILKAEDAGEAKAGELVLCEVLPTHPRLGLREVRVTERLGGLDNHRALSLIAIHEQGLPTVFPEAALANAEAAGPVSAKGRADLRALPLVTIDGADARDFDDAVFAEPDDSAKNAGGWHLVVAIADVAHYVPAGSALDREAYKRGNSTYFPDRVVPMLPEALSNGWCSLRPKEERGCLAAHLWIDSGGNLLRHKFERGIMRSAARLTYEQVQAAADGRPDDTAGPLQESVIAPLYSAFACLLANRQARGALDLDIPERQVILGESGQVEDIRKRQRLDSHRLIEEFMITANVAAASELEKRHQPCMYRVHEPPDPAKVTALSEVLQGLGLKLAKAQTLRPKIFSRLIEQAAKTPYLPMVSELVLRSQSQAYYGPENLGHFGLALQRYAHFTSPIRRYADLLVHRALIDGLKLGDDGLPGGAEEQMPQWGEHISETERRSVAAERDAKDRMTAAFLAERVGEVFLGRVNGVTRFGLFVTLEESGGDVLLPMSSLPSDYYIHDETRHCLVGRRSGRTFTLGETLALRLTEASGLTGSLLGEFVEEDSEAPSTSHKRSASERDSLKKNKNPAVRQKGNRTVKEGQFKKSRKKPGARKSAKSKR